MQPLSPMRPEEHSALAMENELLRYEVRHLRARLKGAEQEVARLERERADAATGDTAGDAVAMTAPGEAGQAHDDLVWLLQRLNNTPAGFALRRQAGFRTLLERYVEGQQQ